MMLYRRRIRSQLLFPVWIAAGVGTHLVYAWIVTPVTTKQQHYPSELWHAKRNRQRDTSDDLNRWYEAVDENATPDDVFWEEMERQIGSVSTSSDEQQQLQQAAFASVATAVAPTAVYNINTINQGNIAASTTAATSSNTPMSPKNIEATLSEYEVFAVADNWLDDDLAELMMAHDDNDENFYKGAPSLDDQLDDWDSDDNDGTTTAWEMPSDEPWDHWGEAAKNQDDDEVGMLMEMDDDRVQIGENDRRRKPSEFLFDENAQGDSDDDEDADAQREEAAYQRRLSLLTVRSERLERARDNAKATAFFQREPDTTEGFDQMWVSAIDNVCFKNLVGTFRNYGIQFADNFGDWQDGCIQDGLASIEDIASYKARQVYAVTGLPCIASRTSFEVEPVPDLTGSSSSSAVTTLPPGQRSAAAIFSNPRVITGYRFNDIGMHVDYICDALRPLSEMDRVTRFKTCLCYYDGEMEIFDYGTCDVDLHFANSLRTFIPVAQAINEMMKTVELTFGLVYQKWLRTRMDEVLSSAYGSASVKLRDRVLKEGRVLPNDIVDVSAFMDSMVDVNLMDECAKELAQRFVNEKPSKILTVATTGLVLALPMAKYLQVPVVYARKERNVVMADTYIAAYSSKTVGKNRELLVSKSHLHEHDRVLIVDDFLSSGASQEALLRIVSQADATAVGIGVLLEKVYDSGRQSLSGFDIPIHSLCRIASVQSGVIQLMEEEGFGRMQQQQQQQERQQKQKQE
jgi:xanthine phosphoribosyltransferase